MKVLAISGSLRAGSWNGLVLQAARELVDGDVEFELYDGLRDVPPYDEDDDVEPAPAAVTRFREAIAGADAILFATPEYNSSVPGQLKNALDWASRPLATNPARNKQVAVGHAHEKFDADGRLNDEQLSEQLLEVVDGLVAAARARAEKLASQAA